MPIGIKSVDRLRLDDAFNDKMVHRPLTECINVKCDERLLVIDDEKTRCSRFGNEVDDLDKALIVVNEKKYEIVLLSIDHQLLTGIQGGIADCALFDDKQFRLVEFKTNAEGNSKKNFDKATSQLKHTIQVFRDRLQAVDIQFEEAVALRCHVVVSHNFPRSLATMQDYQFEFAIDTGGIILSFDSVTYWEDQNRNY